MKRYLVKWYGIWWIILLQYTHVVYTCMSVLHCPFLPEYDGKLVAVSCKLRLLNDT